MEMKKQKMWLLTSLLCIAALIAACAPARSADLPPLRVEYAFWWGDFNLLVAQELGLFKKYGVEVEPVYFEVFSEALPALAASSIDGGLFVADDAISTNDKTPLKVVAVYDDGGYGYVVGVPEIQKPSDLKGKRIGVNLGSIGELFIMETLEQGGLTLRDVTLIDMSVEAVPTTLGTSIDAGFVWDPYASDLLADGSSLLLKLGGTQTITPDVIVFRASVVEERPDDIRAFLKAWFEAVEFRRANPQKANEIIAGVLGVPVEELSEDSYMYSAEENQTLFSGTSTDVRDIKTVMEANIEFLIRIGSLSKIPNLDTLLDPTYLP
jgi:NitT/TauT family transport system substrate-binding protein